MNNNLEGTNLLHPSGATPQDDAYDPFARGEFPVGVRTIQLFDRVRNRLFPCEVWYPAAAEHTGQDISPTTQDLFPDPVTATARSQMAIRNATAQPGTYPLIVFSHSSGGGRRQSTFLCIHLSSHGYLVAALDHSEAIAPELAPAQAETGEQRAGRAQAWIANRVPDIRFLLDQLLDQAAWESEAKIDRARVGLAGHSFGGWTALAAPEVDGRIGAVVALAPGGSSHPRPGILPATLSFRWGRELPTLYLVAENDTLTPLAGIVELFDRTPGTKHMLILQRADHLHFVDNVEEAHESLRASPLTGEAAWIAEAMRPMRELCSGEQAHLFTRGLTLCHLDAYLKQLPAAQGFWAGDVEAELARRGVEAGMYAH